MTSFAGVARRCLTAGRAIRTLQPTALVREAYLRLASRDSLAARDRADDLLVLNDAMKQLALLNARQCKIVELRFFDGLSIEETAEVFEISQATAKPEWATACMAAPHA
jgi:DNA-directed RNA polymerase specialized sigma24 family protein